MEDQVLIQTIEEILGPPVKGPDRRGWATWRCPFHNDRRTPNLGVHLPDGYWRCLACGESGRSVRSLAARLNKPLPSPAFSPSPSTPWVAQDSAPLGIGEAFHRLPIGGADYLRSRGISPRTALRLGVRWGKNLPLEALTLATIQAASRHGILNGREWRWEGGIVWGEPPGNPHFVQVRRTKHGGAKYLTFGAVNRPAGDYLLDIVLPGYIILVEGLFDMLALNQVFLEGGSDGLALAVLGNGMSHQALKTLQERIRRYPVLIVPDPDEGGRAMARRLKDYFPDARVVFPPLGLDPDEAVQRGWLPSPP